ncbi:TIGR00282 family metallophosphoesterase [bacterium]|nr:TIGR00282 family metallophosphoesterase [bacterium]
MRILFLGDIVGKPGRALFQKHIGRLERELGFDGLIVNGENSSHGRGITSRTMKFFKHNGVNVVTSGNHVWANKEIYSYLNENKDLLRPANYPTGCPGVGFTTFSCKGREVAVINVQGRTFMRDDVECPFKKTESILSIVKKKTKLIFVDFHAEASSEKMGLAYFLDGKVSAVFGTHSHVQTADERILPGGTGYITDAGMAGSLNSMIGMTKAPILKRFLTQMPVKFVVDLAPPFVMTGVYVDVDLDTGKTTNIQRVKIIDEDLYIEASIK